MRRAAVVALALAALGAHRLDAAGAHSGSCPEGPRLVAELESRPMAGFDVVVLGADDASRRPVILLHEIGGLSEGTLCYARELARHFAVYAPVLFGEKGSSSFLRGLASYTLTRAWRRERTDRAWRRVSRRLDRLVDEVARRHEPGVAVIGMCLTGSIPLELAGNGALDAVVVAQPSLPLFLGDDASLDLTPAEEVVLEQRADAGDLPVLGLRFQRDTIADREKHLELERRLGDAFVDREICAGSYEDRVDRGRKAHSVLVQAWRPGLPDDHPVAERRAEVVRFLSDPIAFVRTATDADCPPIEGRASRDGR